RPGGEMVTTTTRGAPDTADETRVPYYEVIGDYSHAAEEALSREEVPPAYRETVREYFESLQSPPAGAGGEQAGAGGEAGAEGQAGAGGEAGPMPAAGEGSGGTMPPTAANGGAE
ncbi:MAG TPA: hypothetical protein VM283_02240, partial [Armatimonadota bacterium]|nr:hypothetical protein [Armatimonadota bacterium]